MMMMKTMSKSTLELRVWLADEAIGTLIHMDGDRHWFVFDEAYLRRSTRPLLSLSFKNQEGDIVPATKTIQTRVPPFFSNLLPEGHLRSYLAKQLGIKSEREFFLLAALGADLPGAVRLLPVDFDPLNINDSPQKKTAHKIQQDRILRFSLAGIQLKFSAMLEASGGLTIPADGIGGSWIVKLPSFRFEHIPENEFAMLELARAIDIPVPALKLVPIKEIHGLPEEAKHLKGNALVIERFDRATHPARIHIEDFAQVFGLFPEKKYEKRNYANIAQVLSMETTEKNVADFFRRLIFSMLIGNGDMHLKNWSLHYSNSQKPDLSPAYDFVSTIPYLPQDNLALNFGDSKSFEITSEKIRRFADKTHLSAHWLLQLAEETISHTMDAWKNETIKSILPEKLQQSIGDHLEKTCKIVFN